MTKSKKLLGIILAMVMVLSLAACGGDEESSESVSETSTTEESTSESSESTSEEGGDTAAVEGPIYAVTREDGSGTRGAFTEVLGMVEEVEDANGEMVEVDTIGETLPVQAGTNEVMTYVAGEPGAIGYISLGSLNDTVKAVNVDGVEATEENVTNESYPISRPFNIAINGTLDEQEAHVQDFINFIFSEEGQAIVGENDVVPVDSAAPAYEGDGSAEGTIRVQGSTSVDPVMVALEEAYVELNPGVSFDHTANGSGAGMTAAIEGNADIGMASREVKEEELAEGLEAKAIAIDGIAVIVNNENPIEELTTDQIKDIFEGNVVNWEDL